VIPLRPVHLARFAAGALRYVARSPDAEQTRRRFGARIDRRTETFLATLDATVWRHDRSPWRKLLVAAGLEPQDVVRLVRADGLEGALAGLARAGVRASAAELRGLVPIRRGSFTLHVAAEAFHNPLLTQRAISASTSGSSGSRSLVPYTWALFAEEADAERLLFDACAAAGDPVALWYPAPPGIAGLHNAALHWRFERPLAHWFSQTPAVGWRAAPSLRAIHEAAAALGRLRGAPRPRYLPLDRAEVIAEWLAEGVRRGQRRVLKTFASSAARVARAALAGGLDLRGQLVFAGGEPLTADRLSLLRAVGLVALPRYAATETGMIAGACGDAARAGEMHLYLDRLAVLADGVPVAPPPSPAITGMLAFTSLAASAPLVLLNAELGDHGALRRGACGCALGAAGCLQRISDVTSPEKFAAEGVKLLAMQLAEEARRLVSSEGGTADDVQVWWRESDSAPGRLTVAVDPRVRLDAARFEREFLARVAALSGGSLAAHLWQQAGTIRIVRAQPRPGPGAKQPAAVAEPEPSA
jgi:hypothetical protein